MIGEIRYAIRLCQRTARLYRRVQTAGTFIGVVGGSAAIAGLAGTLPSAVTVLGGVLISLAGAALIAIRPADKAAMNEADVRRYQAIMVKSHQLNDDALAAAIDEAHAGDAPEIEPLRNVAYNDVALELNRADAMVNLTFAERLLRALA